jgi:hypothetical protein
MDRTGFLHEMKEISAVNRVLQHEELKVGKRESDQRIFDLYHHILDRSFNLLDYAQQFVPERLKNEIHP